MQKAFPSRWFVFLALFVSLVALALFGPRERPLTKNKREAQKRLAQGLSAEEHGDTDTAIENFTEALRFEPDSAVAFLNRGIAFTKKGDYERALEDLGKAIEVLEVLPKVPDVASVRRLAYFQRGEVHRLKGDYEQSLAIVAAALLAQLVDVHGLLDVHRFKGDHERSLADFAKAIELNPRDYDAYLKRSAVYERMGDVDRAKEEKDKAIQLNPQLQGN